MNNLKIKRGVLWKGRLQKWSQRHNWAWMPDMIMIFQWRWWWRWWWWLRRWWRQWWRHKMTKLCYMLYAPWVNGSPKYCAFLYRSVGEHLFKKMFMKTKKNIDFPFFHYHCPIRVDATSVRLKIYSGLLKKLIALFCNEFLWPDWQGILVNCCLFCKVLK